VIFFLYICITRDCILYLFSFSYNIKIKSLSLRMRATNGKKPLKCWFSMHFASLANLVRNQTSWCIWVRYIKSIAILDCHMFGMNEFNDQARPGISPKLLPTIERGQISRKPLRNLQTVQQRVNRIPSFSDYLLDAWARHREYFPIPA
jgi:hypothetical protein